MLCNLLAHMSINHRRSENVVHLRRCSTTDSRPSPNDIAATRAAAAITRAVSGAYPSCSCHIGCGDWAYLAVLMPKLTRYVTPLRLVPLWASKYSRCVANCRRVVAGRRPPYRIGKVCNGCSGYVGTRSTPVSSFVVLPRNAALP